MLTDRQLTAVESFRKAHTRFLHGHGGHEALPEPDATWKALVHAVPSVFVALRPYVPFEECEHAVCVQTALGKSWCVACGVEVPHA